MATLADLIPTMGEHTRLRGFFQGASSSEGTDDNGKAKTSNHLTIMVGTALRKVSYKPEEYKHEIPAIGSFVQVFCERGEFKGRPFWNNPGKMSLLADPAGNVAPGAVPERKAA